MNATCLECGYVDDVENYETVMCTIIGPNGVRETLEKQCPECGSDDIEEVEDNE